MALQMNRSEAGGPDASSSLSAPQPKNVEEEEEEEVEAIEPPMHPVHSMQAAFEESIFDSMEEGDAQPSSPVLDPQARRQKLLDSSDYEDSWRVRWKQRPTAQHHPLTKLMAQIVFGMHLLQQQQAKSDEEVVSILHTHVAEVDSFIERATEDFDLAIRDIEDRIRFLKLPMTHREVFETMLDDKTFRTQLLDGNEKIEKIIDRTMRAKNAALLDVQKGSQATRDLSKYLNAVLYRWPKGNSDIADVYGAMRGNEQGWKKYMRDLQIKGNNLGATLAQLSAIIGELAKLAAAASRRNKTQSTSVSPQAGVKSAPSSPGVRSKFSHDQTPPIPASSRDTTILNKPLPKEPQTVGGAAQLSTSKQHPVPFAERYEKPRQSPPTTATLPQRPKTAGGSTSSSKQPRAADARGKPAELLDFLQKSEPVTNSPNPLRSNPPDDFMILSDGVGQEKRLGRSPSHNTNISAVPAHSNKVVTRSRSPGAMNILSIPASNGVKTGGLHGAPDLLNGFAYNDAGTEGTQQKEETPIPRPRLEDRKDSVHSTGFARRLSKRMKHLPRTEEPPTALIKAKEPFVPPPDSAYASGTDKQSPPNEAETGKRPESLLGPLPFERQHQDSPASRPSDTSSDFTTPRPSYAGIAPSVMSIASTSKSRSTLGIRKFFGGKFGKGRKVTA